MVYAREFDESVHDFGVIGVEDGVLILYDAHTRSRWSQIVGRAISGEMEGTRLRKLPSTMTTWGKWRALHPTSTVYVKRSIPFQSRYTGEAFADSARAPEGPARADDLVVGIEGGATAKAYLVRRLVQSGRVVNDHLDRVPIVVYLSEDLSTAKIFGRTVGEQVLTLSTDADDVLVDQETGTRWHPLTGEGLEGPLAGKRLPPGIATHALWYAWKKYRPDTILHGNASLGLGPESQGS